MAVRPIPSSISRYPAHSGVAIGDSLTENDTYAVPMDKFWPGQLQALLQALTPTPCRVQIRNVGVSGQTSEQMLNRRVDMLQHDAPLPPSIGFVFAGFNDATNASTTIASSIATGSQVVTPASMNMIGIGSVLTVANSNGSNSETVTVTAVAATTFTATFASTKTGPGIVVTILSPTAAMTLLQQNIQQAIVTSIAGTVATGSQTVTPGSMTGIVVGSQLYVSNIDGSNGEYVTVYAVSGSTFTATFASTKLANSVVSGYGLVDTLINAGCNMVVIVGVHLLNFPTGNAGDILAGATTDPTTVTARANLRVAQAAAATAAIAAYPGKVAYCDLYAQMKALLALTVAPSWSPVQTNPTTWINATTYPPSWHVQPGTFNLHMNTFGNTIVAQFLLATIQAQAGWITALQ